MNTLHKFATSIEDVPAARVRFGLFELDPKSGELSCGERKVVLPQQPFQILLLLIKHPGETVTRDEIQNRLWSEDITVDFDIGINQAVRRLRRLLRDSADEPRFIETLGRRGYRLKVPVEWVNNSSVTIPPSAPVVERDLAQAVPAEVEDATYGPEYSTQEGWFPSDDSADPAEHLARERYAAFGLARNNPRRVVERNDVEGKRSLFMGLLDGQYLRKWLARASAHERADVLQQLLRIAAQIASGGEEPQEINIVQGTGFGSGARCRQFAVQGNGSEQKFRRAR